LKVETMDLAARTRRLARTLATAAASSIAVTALALCSSSCSDQPKVRCAARGQYAAKYTLVSGSGDCSMLAGDLLGVGTYNGSNGDGTPNWDDATIAIQPYALAGLTGGAKPSMAGDSLFASGHFSTAAPNDQNFCEVPTLSAAEVHVAAVAGATTDPMTGTVTCPSPAEDVKYEWSNVRVVVSAAVLGTELAADLKYTANGCTATYRVWAVSPAVTCALPPATPPPPTTDDAGTDDATPTSDATAVGDASDASDAGRASDAGARVDASMGSASSDAAADGGAGGDAASASPDASTTDGGLPPVCTEPPPATPAPSLDPTLCSPVADLSKNRPLGSGLNPDLFPDGITCDTATTFCVLTRDPSQ
jgi:hypothetical protein